MTDRLVRALDDARRRWVPDRRLGVFEVWLEETATGSRTLRGVTTSEAARDAVRRLAADAGIAESIRLLPDDGPDEERVAIVTTAVAPLTAEPRATAPRVTEALHGEPLDLLERRGAWVRVRARDGFHAWAHTGYLALGSAEWGEDWDARAGARSLGCELRGADVRLRLPIGARLALLRDGTIETADGRRAQLGSGTVRLESEARAEARLVAPTEWALRWFGDAPFAIGGRTEWGCDGAGLTQAVFAARGVALQREVDQQISAGRDVTPDRTGRGYEAGDLLFFAEQGRVHHVAVWAGAGRIVHALLGRGRVTRDDLFDESGPVRHLAGQLVAVRRIPA